MKLFLFSWVLILQISTSASTIEVIGACSDQPLFISADVSHESNKTLGDFTVEIFQKQQIPFNGSREGVAQIFDSVMGDEAIEVLSDEEARFYGWCVHVDGIETNRMPDQVLLENPHSKITWFYAYASVYRNEWREMCVPVHLLKPSLFCKN